MKIDPLKFALSIFIASFVFPAAWIGINFFVNNFWFGVKSALDAKELGFILGNSLSYFFTFYIACLIYNFLVKNY